MEIRASTYISAKLKKRTYMYDSLQFPVEMNTRGSKTLTTFIPFHTKYDLQEQFWLFSHSYLQNGMLWLLNNFNILHDLKNWYFWTLSSHIQLHMYEFTNSVSLLGSSRGYSVALRWRKAPVRIPSNYSSTPGPLFISDIEGQILSTSFRIFCLSSVAFCSQSVWRSLVFFHFLSSYAGLDCTICWSAICFLNIY